MLKLIVLVLADVGLEDLLAVGARVEEVFLGAFGVVSGAREGRV